MKYAGDGVDPYLAADGQALRNLFEIKTQAELDKVESSLSFLRASELRERPVLGKFDLDHLKAIHQRLFGDVYDWAGDIRTVEISKGSTVFARHTMIERAGQQLFRELAMEGHLQGLGVDEFSARAGHYLGEVNVLHPFREGNGRTQREFIGQLAEVCGHRLSWNGISQAAMTEASIAAYHGDSSGLAGLIRGAMLGQALGVSDADRAKRIKPMKQRLLVMNGQRLVQSEQAGVWGTDKVEKAGAVKAGIYNIHLSTQADQTKAYDGVILHADKDSVYQQVGKNFVKHDRSAFDKVPEIGSKTSVRYDGGKAVTTAASLKQGRSI